MVFTGASGLNPSLCAWYHPLKTLQKYLVGQVLAALLLTVAVFTAVLLIGNALKEILSLLASSHVSLLLLVKAVVCLIPFVWVFALPMGMLTATLLVFGRFSADQELTAARAGGISLLALIMPVLLLSLFGCTLSAWFNLDLGPRCRVGYLALIEDVKKDLVNAQLPANTFIHDFPNLTLYTEKSHAGVMDGVKIWLVKGVTNSDAYIWAAHGQIETDRTNNQLLIVLTDVRMVNWSQKEVHYAEAAYFPYVLSTNLNTHVTVKPQLNDMTFLQLRQELHDLENLHIPIGTNNSSVELKKQLATLRAQQGDFTEPIRVAMNRQVAFSFACFGFTLVGIPLGIRVHRRETNIGIAIALLLVLGYYAFIMLGQGLSSRPEFYPHLIVWVPNFVFQAVGAVLLWRANKGI